jgi:anaerobic nitric oxide reductase transcription regulator
VRVLAATNRDLPAEVSAGRFRADLFHRLNVYPLGVPALRERGEDVALLGGYFCDIARRRMGVGPVRLDASAIDALASYPWPGNVRELENVISRVVLRQSGVVRRGDPIVISGSHLAADVGHPEISAGEPVAARPSVRHKTLREASVANKRDIVERALAAHQGNFSRAGSRHGPRQLPSSGQASRPAGLTSGRAEIG